jgi:hypothetical protein
MANKAYTDMFQSLKQNKCQTRPEHPADIFFKIKGKIKTFYDKHKLKQFMTTKSVLQKILKEILCTGKEER